MKWISQLLGRTEESSIEPAPLQTFKRKHLRLHVYEEPRHYGQIRHRVEFERFTCCSWSPEASIGANDLQDAIILLCQAKEFIEKEHGEVVD